MATINDLRQRHNLDYNEAKELSNLLYRMRSQNFRNSGDLSSYIRRNKLGYDYPHISGVVRMRDAHREWDFKGGFPKNIYAIICQELGLSSRGSRAEAVSFKSYHSMKNKQPRFQQPTYDFDYDSYDSNQFSYGQDYHQTKTASRRANIIDVDEAMFTPIKKSNVTTTPAINNSVSVSKTSTTNKNKITYEEALAEIEQVSMGSAIFELFKVILLLPVLAFKVVFGLETNDRKHKSKQANSMPHSDASPSSSKNENTENENSSIDKEGAVIAKAVIALTSTASTQLYRGTRNWEF